MKYGPLLNAAEIEISPNTLLKRIALKTYGAAKERRLARHTTKKTFDLDSIPANFITAKDSISNVNTTATGKMVNGLW